MDLIFKDLDVKLGNKVILDQVTGMVKRGEMLAIMGPSGAGKSTLLNAIAGRCDITGGQIAVDNQPIDRQLRRKIAYVTQENVFFPKLTLMETLKYNALLRLPEKIPEVLKLQRINEVMKILGLEKCASTVIGDAVTPGLSGGEKKRASIALELITNPPVLLLDEPTSGLDGFIAYKLMQTICNYTEQSNKTIIATIHQPSSHIFHVFHNVLLLSNGKVIYFGKTNKVLDFFGECGFYYEPQYNPSDFLLQVMSESDETVNNILEHYKESRSDLWPSELLLYDPKNQKKHGQLLSLSVDYLQTYTKKDFQNSSDSGIDTNSIASVNNLPIGNIMDTDKYIKTYHDRTKKFQTGFITQFKVLLKRTMKITVMRIFSPVALVTLFIRTAIYGTVWFQYERNEQNINDLFGLAFTMVISSGYYALNQAMFSFSTYKSVIQQERASGAYRLSAYYLSVCSCELLLLWPVNIILFTTIYFICGMTYLFKAFFTSLGLFVIGTTSLFFYGMLLGILIPDPAVVLSAALTSMILFFVFGDFFRSTKNIPYWLQLLKYVSPIFYSYQNILNVELSYTEPYKCGPKNETSYSECAEDINGTALITGNMILERNLSLVPTWIGVIVHLSLTIICLIGGYVYLTISRKPVRK